MVIDYERVGQLLREELGWYSYPSLPEDPPPVVST